ncbi:cytochrome P450, partial [Collybia nuda]
GGLMYFRGLGNSILVLNDLDTILDLLVKKGNTHSSRPHLVVACELMGLTNSTAFAPFGDVWKLHRKFCRAALNTEATKSYDNVLMDIATNLNTSLRSSPLDFTNHVRLMAGRVIMSIVYGISVESADDPYIVRAEATMSMISKAVVPGEFFVDLLPFLKHIPPWFPFTRFHKVGQDGKEMIAELVRKPFQHVQEEMGEGTAPPSFTQDVLTKPELEGERNADPTFEHAVQWAAASMYAAGQEVVSSSVLNMIMGLALNPEKLKRAQAELDHVVGRERRPIIQDRQSLPYVHAIVKETLRWHPPLPMSIARSSIQDDYYNGYFIPKNTTIIPNIWVIAHAPDPEFPPQLFLPERFLPRRGSPPPDPSSYCFGFGRRICPGKILAENALFLMTASIIHEFNITP